MKQPDDDLDFDDATQDAATTEGHQGDDSVGKTAKHDVALFYRKLEALSPEIHSTLSLKDATDYSFATDANSIPLLVNEFVDAQRHYPIVFSELGEMMPFAVVGGFDGGNLFLDELARWGQEHYVPAYVRRYPFISARDGNTGRSVLAFDPDSVLVSEGDFRPLYQNANPTKVLEDTIEFCRKYAAAEEYTVAFCQAMSEHGLFVEGHVTLTLHDEKVRRYSGFLVINREVFSGLSSEVTEGWRENGWLEAIYAHFASFGAWDGIRLRLETDTMGK